MKTNQTTQKIKSALNSLKTGAKVRAYTDDSDRGDDVYVIAEIDGIYVQRCVTTKNALSENGVTDDFAIYDILGIDDGDDPPEDAAKKFTSEKISELAQAYAEKIIEDDQKPENRQFDGLYETDGHLIIDDADFDDDGERDHAELEERLVGELDMTPAIQELTADVTADLTTWVAEWVAETETAPVKGPSVSVSGM